MVSRASMLSAVVVAAILSPVIPAVAGATQQDSSSNPPPQAQSKPDAASQHEAIKMPPPGPVHRGANASDDDMEKFVEYLAKNYGPNSPAPAASTLRAASAPAAASTPTEAAGAMKLPPLKPQATPEKVVEEHFAALNACDWNRLMAQYAEDMTFFSKDGGMVQGREAIGAMFKKAVQPPSGSGQCGMKMTPLHIKVVGTTVNVVWRAEATFFTQPYQGSEAFETRDGLLAAQVTTWDPSALPMKQ